MIGLVVPRNFVRDDLCWNVKEIMKIQLGNDRGIITAPYCQIMLPVLLSICQVVLPEPGGIIHPAFCVCTNPCAEAVTGTLETVILNFYT